MKILTELVSPIDVESFFDTYFTKQPLFSSKDSTFDDICSLDDINEYLGGNSLSYPFCRVIGDGVEVPLELYKLNDGGTFNILDKRKLFSLFGSGKSLVIQGAQFQFPKLFDFVKRFENELGMDVNANIYITPSANKGFNPHYDTHEVFVLQLSGSKHWNIYDKPIDMPIKGFGLTKEQQEIYRKSTPSHEIVLQPGDLLYLPSGVVHEAYCTDELSIHITVGVSPFLRTDLLRELVKAAENDIYFRQPFCHYAMSNKSGSMDQEFYEKLVNKLNEVVRNDFIQRRIERKFFNAKDLFGRLFLIDNASSEADLAFLDNVVINDQEKGFSNYDKSIIDWLRDREERRGFRNISFQELKVHLKSLINEGIISFEIEPEKKIGI